MSSLKHSPLPTLQSLASSFTDLESILEPLLAHKYDALNAALQANSSLAATQPGPSTSDEGSSDELRGRLDAARMQVSVAYVLMDLVWILLKTKGVDTSSHPVMQELERVKSYFKKIQQAQSKESEESKDHSKVDKSAAGRFIRAALSGAAAEVQGKHTKFDDESSVTVAELSPKKSKKSAEASPEKTSKSPAKTDGASTPKSKKKRPAMDPFEGYDKPATPKQSQSDSAASSPSKKKKKHKKAE